MKLSYRQAVPGDFLKIAALDRISWGDAEEDRYIPDGEHAWRLWVEYTFVPIAVDQDDNIYGAGLAFPCLYEEHKKLLAVHKLFVNPDFRGHGIGTALFEIITNYCDQYEYSAFLSVKPENQSAQAVYSKLGFEISDEIKGYYRPYEDRLIMLRKPK